MSRVPPGARAAWLLAALTAPGPAAPGAPPQEPTPVVLQRDAAPRPATPAEVARQRVDFRWSPPTWDTAICLPDDAQKTLVTEDGELLYDYPGAFARCRTRIGARVAGLRRQSQALASPRTPVVLTVFADGGGARLTTRCLAVPPGIGLPARPAVERPPALLEPIGAQRPEPGWGRPEGPADGAFRNVDVGWGSPIAWRLRADAAEPVTLALGFIESYHERPGARVLEVHVEGELRRTLDPLAEWGRHAPGVVLLDAADRDGDGWIALEVRCTEGSPDANATLAAIWAFARGDPQAAAPAAEALAAGTAASPPPLAFVDCGAGRRRYDGPPRGDLMLLERAGTSAPLQVVVDSQDPLEPAPDRRGAALAGASWLAFSAPFADVDQDGQRTVFTFPPTLDALALYCATGHEADAVGLDWARAQLGRAERYWAGLDLPYGALQVPDPGVQALLDASIRNIWQARELRDGLPAFQVGPTCYRGLWVVDGAFLLEAVAYLGRGLEARAGIEHLLTFQREDGSFELLDAYWKENGIVLYVLYRHALLTGDRAWLEGVWPRVERVVGAIRALRERSREDPDAPCAGLLPPGFPDGGVGGVVAEYTNVYWCLAGLRAAAAAAELLGREEQRADWQGEYEDLLATFRRAAERTRLPRDDGTFALPILMEPDPAIDPVRGQWAFCHAVHPGQVFAPEDPLVRGTLALLDEHECEGLVLGTGWMADGLWNYFASFYAHAHLWAGHGEKAADVLYAFANHASPLLAWREEQPPRGGGERIVGDMPHNWASAEFIRLCRNLLVLERGRELHLLEGLPRAWLRPGAVTRLRGVATDFGPLDLELAVDDAGRGAGLRLRVPDAAPPERVVVHLGAWAGEAQPPRRGADGWVELALEL